jgi:eukaryotic-like serine/threonine-protein kinase
MAGTIVLKVIKGNLAHPEYIFDGRDCLLVGRMPDCSILIPNQQAYGDVSRYHCHFDINPPRIIVRDYGSLHGTFVNNELIGKRGGESASSISSERELQNDDIVRLGKNVQFAVQVVPATDAIEVNHDIYRTTPHSSPPEKPCSSVKASLLPVDYSVYPAEVQETLQNYEVIKRLGKGASGTVWQARRITDNKMVAIKIVLYEGEPSEREQQYLRREMEILQQLAQPEPSPHIVDLYEVFETEHACIFVMEYCDGGSIQDEIKRQGGTLPIRRAVEITQQALIGLEEAHTKSFIFTQADGNVRRVVGVVHRDIKPDNLLLHQGRVKIADYGIAKAFDLAGMSGMSRTGIGHHFALGTIGFMSRVQCIKFKYVAPEVDIWATAATLYFLLTGKTPRRFTREQDYFEAILMHPPVPIQERRSDIPDRLATIIDGALVDNPSILVKTAQELHIALETWEQEDKTHA